MGAFSAFRAGEGNTPDHAETEPEIETDEPISLPMDLSEATATLLAQVRSEKNLLARSIAFGKDRVNCITLWFPPTLVQLSAGAYDEEVAVLANNDSSVIVARLRDHEALDKITYPDFMNRGVLSPDGRLLIAISDDPYLYVHERKKKKPDAGVATRTADQPAYEWSQCGRIQLKSQRKDDRSDNRFIYPHQPHCRHAWLTISRGSFAACFSSTGRYLAVGTQYGTISIFDVATLTLPGEDALLTSFTTSRPNSEFGAVRDMAFSPGPIDLLAWTEDRGRVGVVDIRTGFTSRQFLDLDRDNDFEHLAVTDRSAIDPRLIERIDQGESSSSGLANMLEHSVESRQNRHSEEQESLGRYNIPLTPEETAVLEAIQDFRRRQVQYNPASNRTGTESGSNSGSGSSNGGGGGGVSGAGTGIGTRSLWVTQPGEGARATEGARPRERTASVSRAVTEILENIRDQRERIRDSQERIRTREESNAERRRYATNPFSGSTNALGTAGSGNSERRGLVARLIANTSSGPTGGWDNVEALYDPSPPSGNHLQPPSNHTTGRIMNSRAHADSFRRSRAAYLMREWEDNPTRRVLGTYMPSSHIRPGPYDTAGLSWNEDGDIL